MPSGVAAFYCPFDIEIRPTLTPLTRTRANLDCIFRS